MWRGKKKPYSLLAVQKEFERAKTLSVVFLKVLRSGLTLPSLEFKGSFITTFYGGRVGLIWSTYFM